MGRLIQVFQNPSSAPGGTEKIMERIGAVASALGYQCEEIHNQTFPLRNITRRFTMLNPLAHIAQLSWQARRQLRAADVVISHGIYGPFLPGRARIHVFHGTHSGTADAIRAHIPRLDYLVARYLWGGVYERLSARVSACIAVSNFVAKEALRYYNKQARIIPNTINPTFFQTQPLSKKELRSKLDLPADKKLLLVVGRRERLKGWALCKDLLDVLPEHCMLISVGQGSDPHHPRLVTRDPVSPDELREYYSAADWTISPSLYEGFGLTLLESWACGTPVIASPTGLAHDLRGQSALLDACTAPRTDDFKALLEVIERVIDNETLASAQAQWGKKLTTSRFSEEGFCKSWAEVLGQTSTEKRT